LQDTELNGSLIHVREDRAPGGGGGGRGSATGSTGGYGGRGGGRFAGGRGGRGGPGRGRGSSSPLGAEGTQLYVGNLSYETGWRELKDHFRQIGEVKRAEIASTSFGQSRGFGFVQFFNKADTELAIARLNGSELQGRDIEVRLDQKTPR
jgi:RNA recognition motif. (a.k.a. RRM, RBD, or RNP domain)